MDPLLRPSAKSLLGHKYLSLNTHTILSKLEATLNEQAISEESKQREEASKQSETVRCLSSELYTQSQKTEEVNRL